MIPEPATVQMVAAKTEKGDSVNVYTVTTKYDAAVALKSEEVETYQPIYDEQEKVIGSEKRMVTRMERQVFHFDEEGAEGDVFRAIYMLNDKVLKDVVAPVPKLQEGQVCKMNRRDHIFQHLIIEHID